MTLYIQLMCRIQQRQVWNKNFAAPQCAYPLVIKSVSGLVGMPTEGGSAYTGEDDMMQSVYKITSIHLYTYITCIAVTVSLSMLLE